MATVLSNPEVIKRFDSFAFDPLTWPLNELGQRLDQKEETYKGLIQKANISLD